MKKIYIAKFITIDLNRSVLHRFNRASGLNEETTIVCNSIQFFSPGQRTESMSLKVLNPSGSIIRMIDLHRIRYVEKSDVFADDSTYKLECYEGFFLITSVQEAEITEDRTIKPKARNA